MVRGWRGAQVCAEMKLRAEKDEREKQSQDAKPVGALVHVANRTELREEWLRGQVLRSGTAV
jgi:hypothetical protein